MSLVNDMLVDLNSRNIDAGYTPLIKMPSSYRMVKVLGLVFFVVIFSIIIKLNYDHLGLFDRGDVSAVSVDDSIDTYNKEYFSVSNQSKKTILLLEDDITVKHEIESKDFKKNNGDTNNVNAFKTPVNEKEVSGVEEAVLVDGLKLKEIPVATKHANEVNSNDVEKLHISISVEKDDSFVFEQAKKVFENRGANAAIAYLKTAIGHSAPMPKSSLLLIDILFDERGEAMAMAFVEQREHKNIGLMHYIHARILIAKGKYSAALNILHQHQENPAIVIRQNELQAALYQKIGQYQQASLLYRKLIDYDPNASRYWLGLAISQDKLAEDTVALDAYTHAARMNDLSVPIKQFVRERIFSLAQGAR